MTFKNLKFIETADSSLSLWEPRLDEGYHNKGGAYTESKTVYAGASNLTTVLSQQPTELTLLDACFGLGYNTWTWLQALLKYPQSLKLQVTAVELDKGLIETWPTVLRQPCYSETPLRLLADHLEDWASGSTEEECPTVLTVPFAQHHLSLAFYINPLQATLPKLVHQEQGYHWVFHDAFSPRRLPALWEPTIFESYFQLLQQYRGECLTYSCARQVRDSLSAAGFLVQKIPGASGKKHSLKGSISAG